MSIAVLVLALVAYGYAMLSYPEFRRPGLIGGVLVVAALAAYFLLAGPEANRAADRIEPAEIVLSDLAIEENLRGATLTGRVRNDSARFRLRDLTLTLRLRDCAVPDTPPADCPVIGESRAIARPDVPPGQIRALSAHFIFSDLPPVAGTLRWDWTIVDTRATLD